MQVDRVIERITFRLPRDDGKTVAGAGWLCDAAELRAEEVRSVAEVQGDPAAGRYALIELASGEVWLVRGDPAELRALLERELRQHRYAGPVAMPTIERTAP